MVKWKCVNSRQAFLSQPKNTSIDDTTGEVSQIVYPKSVLITSDPFFGHLSAKHNDLFKCILK